MTKAELIDRIARSRDLPPDITKKCIAQVLDHAFHELSSYFARGKVTRSQTPRFAFPGFGTFTKKKRSARRGVNPRTLEPIQIEACYTLDFKPSTDLRSAMNPVGDVPKPARGKSSRRAAKRVAAEHGTTEAGRRRLTPRDEDAELDALIGDDVLFDEDLPEQPMQRSRTRTRGGSRTGTDSR